MNMQPEAVQIYVTEFISCENCMFCKVTNVVLCLIQKMGSSKFLCLSSLQDPNNLPEDNIFFVRVQDLYVPFVDSLCKDFCLIFCLALHWFNFRHDNELFFLRALTCPTFVNFLDRSPWGA